MVGIGAGCVGDAGVCGAGVGVNVVLTTCSVSP